MAIVADPWFARPEPKKRERDERFEDVLTAGREAKEALREAHQPGQEAVGGTNGTREGK